MVYISSFSEEEIVPQQQEELEGNSEADQEKEGEDEKALAKKKTQKDEVIEVKVDACLGEVTAIVTSVNGEVAQLQMKRMCSFQTILIRPTKRISTLKLRTRIFHSVHTVSKWTSTFCVKNEVDHCIDNIEKLQSTII